MSSLLPNNPFVDRLNSTCDFVPEWDVPSLNREVFETLLQRIEEIRNSPSPDPVRKVEVLLGPSGYGKTHLFGRIQHTAPDEMLVLFVPQIEDVRRPLYHLRYHLVERLFEEHEQGNSLIERYLARISATSFQKCFASLSPKMQQVHSSFVDRLEEEPGVVLDILGRVQELSAFQQFATSLANAHPSHSEVVRALALGWSPVATQVRLWLRGERMTVGTPDDLGLSPESPEATSVFCAVAKLLSELSVPLVVCWDQLEKVLKEENGFKHLSTDLIKFLHEVPNLLIVLSCFEDDWKVSLANQGYQAFFRRTRSQSLSVLTEEEGIELVQRRLRRLNHERPTRESTWPFRESAIRGFVQKYQPKPSTFLRTLAEQHDAWQSKNEQGWIEQIGSGPIIDLALSFRQEWESELAKIQSKSKAPFHQQSERLYRAVKEVLGIWKLGKSNVGGCIAVDLKEPGTMHSPVASDIDIEISAGTASKHVVVGVTKETGGKSFSTYLGNLASCVKGKVIGAVLIRPTNDLSFGPTTQGRKKYEKLVDDKKLRPFAFEDHLENYHILECCLRMLDRAAGKELQIGQQLLSAEKCRELIVQIGVLDNLKLAKVILADWIKAPTAVVQDKPVLVAATQAVGAEAPVAKKAANSLPIPSSSASTSPDKPPQHKPTVPNDDDVKTDAWATKLLEEICDKLTRWGQKVEADGFLVGPTFARFKVIPLGSTDFGKVQRKAENLKINLALPAKPIIGSQSGYISIDVQLPNRRAVPLAQALKSESERHKGEAAFPLGSDVEGKTHWVEFADPSNCHLLIAGTTGSGKSELLKMMLASMAYRLDPQKVQFILIDPKLVTFNFQGESPFFAKPIAYSVDEAIPLVQYCFEETNRRYQLLQSKQLQNIGQLEGNEALPRIVVIFDEFADLMMDKESKQELERHLKSIGAKARAAGIHLVLATQRPEASVVTPLLRSNLPGRICLHVPTGRDSKLILDQEDAANLLGKGDLLWKHGADLTRLQCPLVRQQDLEKVLRIH